MFSEQARRQLFDLVARQIECSPEEIQTVQVTWQRGQPMKIAVRLYPEISQIKIELKVHEDGTVIQTQDHRS